MRSSRLEEGWCFSTGGEFPLVEAVIDRVRWRAKQGRRRGWFTEFLSILLERIIPRYALLFFLYSFLRDIWELLVSMFVYLFIIYC